MSVTYWKELLRPGRYHLPDGRVFEYTRSMIADIAKTSNEMLRAGLVVPICYEHDPKADPVTMSQFNSHPNAWIARGYAGSVGKFRVSTTGTLEALQQFARSEDAEASKRIKYVSPRLNFDFQDEDGVVWKGITIGHVALTPKPVDRRQQPAEFGQNVSPKLISRKSDCHELSLGNAMDPLTPEPLADPQTADLIDALAANGLTVTGASIAEIIQALRAMAGVQPDDTLATAPPAMMMSWLGPVYESKSRDDKAKLIARIEALERTGVINGHGKSSLMSLMGHVDFSVSGYNLKSGELRPNRLLNTVEALETYSVPKAFGRQSGDMSFNPGSETGTTRIAAPRSLTGGTQDQLDAAALKELEDAWKN